MTLKKISQWLNVAEPKMIDGKNTVHIYIEGVIGWCWWSTEENAITTKEQMRAELTAIAALSADKIIVNISSYGGDVDHALAMHDLLKVNPAIVETNVYGMTASAATIIAQAADKGLRKISDNSLYLVHCGSSGTGGNKFDAQTFLDDLKAVDGRIANIYAKASGRTPEECLALMELNNGGGKWLSPDETLTEKLVDEVYEPMKAVALVMPNKHLFHNLGLPEIPSEKLFFVAKQKPAAPEPIVANNPVIINPIIPPVMAKKVTTLKQITNFLTVLNTKKIQNLTPEETADVTEAIAAADALSKMLTQLKTGTAPDDNAPENKIFKTVLAKLTDKAAGKVVALTPDEDTQLAAAITLINEGVTMASELTNTVETVTENVVETPEQKRIKALEVQNKKLEAMLALQKAGETVIENEDDPGVDGRKKPKNESAHDANAAALKGK